VSWDAIGAVAEIVGAVAVVVTLIFLTLQIRQNTASVRQQCYNDIFVRRQEILLRISESEDLHRIWARALSGERITADEGNRFTFIQAQMLKHLEDCFVQYQAGVVTRAIWEREVGMMATSFAFPGFLAWWNEARQFFLPEFVEAMARHRPLPLVLYDEMTGTWGRPGGPPTF
jgi:uncharacterized protein YllA (UPF0747 family)